MEHKPLDAGDSLSCPPYKSGCRVDMGAYEFDQGYICGDVNGDQKIELADVIYLARYLFGSGSPPVPIEAGQIDCKGEINLGDVIYLANYLLKGGPPPCCPY